MRRLLPDLGTLLLSCTLLTAFLGPAHALVVRKPSAYDSGAGSPVDASGNRASPASLSLLGSRADFDRLARIYDAGSANAMPHLLFVIDRQSKPAKIYFINTPRYAFHEDFCMPSTCCHRANRRSTAITASPTDALSWHAELAAHAQGLQL